jgi:hypothetical protein
MPTCKHCRHQFVGLHQCAVANRTIQDTDRDDLILSAVIGAVTDNALLGGLLGGSIVGGILGDAIGGDGGLF